MKTVLLKFSGKSLDDLFVNDAWLKIIKNLKDSYDALVIVHGAGKSISNWCNAMGLESKFHNGQRVTDENTMEIVASVQAGLLNAKFVSRLLTNNIKAVGLTGIDNDLCTAEYFDKTLGYVGIPVFKNTNFLFNLLQDGVIPVFSSISRDKDGNLMNINADIFAKELAISIKADTVLFLSDISGVKLDGSVKAILNEADITEGISKEHITDGMIPKLLSCVDLIQNGIDKVWIGNDLSNHNFKNLQTENLKGTWIVKSKTIAA
jgi:acetylglutamate kinase